MKLRFTSRTFVKRQSFVWLMLFMCTPLARGQSADDVHVVPQQRKIDPGSIADTVSIKVLPTPASSSSNFYISVDLVLVPVSVSDSMDRPVITLKKENFALFDENKPQDIRYFSHEDAPVSVAVLLDVSKSMTDKIDSERTAITEFFKNANPEDEYIGITFSTRPRVLTSPRQSIDEVTQKLTDVQPGGATALLDAVYLAISELRSARYQRKAIVIISDGGDNASRYTLRQVKALVQESDVQIYAVGLFETFFFNTLEERLGKRWLREITDATGGRTLTVDDRTKLPDATGEISRLIRSQYVVGYRAPNAAKSRWRKIRVKILASSAEHPLRAHYKSGYITAE